MLKDVEETLEKYFSSEWDEKDILSWINKKRFDLDIPALNANLREPVKDFLLRGGKRWRPVLFLTILKLLGADWKKYLDIAVAIELAHNGTLIIDDIEDFAELRRGKPTCHLAFGLDTAVNAGMTIHFLPLRILLTKGGLAEKQKLQFAEIYTEEIINVYFGQTLDIAWHKRPRPITVEEYLEMTRLKTGGLVRMAGRLACVIARREDLENVIVNFSELAGIAFQIKDDALEFESDEKTFGKSFGNDISEGKISLPVIFALQKMSGSEREWLLHTLGLHTKDQEILGKAMDMIKGSGAVQESLAYAEELVDDSWKEIELKLSDRKEEDVEEFKHMTYSLVKRAK